MRRALRWLTAPVRRGLAALVRTFRLDRRTVGLAALVFCGASVGGGALGYKGYVYAWIAPEFCYLCHIHDYAVEDWRRSIHGDLVTCHDCHRVPLMHYTKTFVHTFWDRPSFPEDLHALPEISSETCESCHLGEAAAFHELSSPMPLEVFESIIRIDDSPGHLRHMEARSRDPGDVHGGAGEAPVREPRLPRHGHTAEDVGFGSGEVQCIDCHGNENNRFHNFQARAGNCLDCHADLVVRGEHLDEFDCKHCHYQEFLAPVGLAPQRVPAVSLPIQDPMIR